MFRKVFAVLNPNLSLVACLQEIKCLFWNSSQAPEKLKAQLAAYFPKTQQVLLAWHARALIYKLLIKLKREFPKKNQVILPAYTCRVVLNAVHKAGLKAILIDSKPGSLDLDLKQAKAAIKPQTLLFFLQHTFGQHQAIQSLLPSLKQNQVLILEDLAHSFHNPKSGDIGDFVLLSFGANKLFASSYGGALINRTQLKIETDLHELSLWLIKVSHIRSILSYLALKLYALKLGVLIAKLLKFNSPALRQVSSFEKLSQLKQIQYFSLANSQAKICARAFSEFPCHYQHRKKLFQLYKKHLKKNLKFISEDTPQGLFYPIKTQNPQALYHYLKTQGFYSNLSWTGSNLVPKVSGQTSHKSLNAYNLSLHILGLPVNLQTQPQDVIRLCHSLNRYYEKHC